MIVTAYFGLLRVGEITQSEHALKAANVQIGENKEKLMLILESSKTHGKDKMSQIVKLVGRRELCNWGKRSSIICPFTLVNRYIRLCKKRKWRDQKDEQFFIYSNRSPVTSHEYRKILKKLVKMSGFNEKFYDTHSTRSGRAIDLYHIAKLSL